MTNSRDFKGIWIPKEIWLAEDLSTLEKVFLAEIDSLDGAEGCYASNDYFAEFFNLSKDRCSDVISSLQKKKRIQVILNKIAQNKDRRIIRGVWAFSPRPSRQKSVDRIGGKAEQITKHIKKPISNTESASEEGDPIYKDPNFLTFWNLYPKKTGKGDAWKAWQKLKVSDTLSKRIFASIESHAGCRQWKNEDGRFIPNPATFLNQRRFDDEVEQSSSATKKVSDKYKQLA